MVADFDRPVSKAAPWPARPPQSKRLKFLAESLKLIAENEKLIDENEKLIAESEKLISVDESERKKVSFSLLLIVASMGRLVVLVILQLFLIFFFPIK